MIREAIQDELRRRDWTMADLARAVGWSHQEVSRYLRGDTEIRTDRAALLLITLGLEIVNGEAVSRRRGGAGVTNRDNA